MYKTINYTTTIVEDFTNEISLLCTLSRSSHMAAKNPHFFWWSSRQPRSHVCQKDNYMYVFVILTIATRFLWWLYIYIYLFIYALQYIYIYYIIYIYRDPFRDPLPILTEWLGTGLPINLAMVLAILRRWFPLFCVRKTMSFSFLSMWGSLNWGLGSWTLMTGWWFGTCFIFPYIYIGNNNPNWLLFFRL